MVSRRNPKEIALRERIYTLRLSSTPPMPWRKIAETLVNGADGLPPVEYLRDLKDARSSVRVKFNAYVKLLREQVGKQTVLATAKAIEHKSAVPVVVPADIGSADVEAELIYGRLKTLFLDISRGIDEKGNKLYTDPVLVGGLANIMEKFIKRMDIREKEMAGGAFAMRQLVTVVIECLEEESVEVQERFAERLYNRFGENLQRHITLPAAGSSGVCEEGTESGPVVEPKSDL